MRATIHVAWQALRDGGEPREVAAQIAGAFAIAAILFLCGGAFLLLEPLP